MRKSCLDYPVEIVEDVFAEGNAVLADMLKKITGAARPRVMLVADQNVVAHTEGLGTRIGRWVQVHDIELAGSPLLMPGGERIKDDEQKSAMEIVRATLKAKVGATSVVLVMGGGTLLDVTGWAVSQVRGGIPIVRMPTTPTAMVEAAFAEYAALDCAGVKDALRIARPPAGVLIDLAFARTVLDGVWRAGFAVAMRLAVVSDAALTKKLIALAGAYRERDAAALKDLVSSTVAVRMKKGGTDFALWAAHRLESLSDYKLPYGYAVALGMCVDMSYAVLKGVLSESDRQKVCDAITASGVMDAALHSRHLFGRDELVLFGLDAWNLLSGTGALTLPTALGKSDVEPSPDRDTMKRAINLLK